MASSINTNIASINAQRNLTLSGSSLSTTMQRLSSGLRVNSAKDDAAGLAISERMNTQVRGMAVAQRNANDGISLSQTAEGAMQKLTDILQRSRELAVQAVNWTNSPSDRKALDSERAQLLEEFSRIASTSNFNGKPLLNGAFIGQTFQVGANSGEVISINLPSLEAENLGAAIWSAESVLYTDITRGDRALSAGDLIIRGNKIAVDQNESITSLAKKVNSAAFDPKIYADISGSSAWVNFGTPATWPVQVTIKLANGDVTKSETVSFTWNPNDSDAVKNALLAINNVSDKTGIQAKSMNSQGMLQIFNETEEIRILNDSAADVSMLVTNWNGNAFSDFENVAGANGNGFFGGVNDVIVGSALTLISEDDFSVVGGYYDEDDNPVGPIPDANKESSRQARLLDAKLISSNDANRALIIYDAAIKQISRVRADIGAIQSRFESVINNLSIAEENTAAARGRIVDADYAIETATLSRTQILQQAGFSMVAQANQVPQQVLELLKR